VTRGLLKEATHGDVVQDLPSTESPLDAAEALSAAGVPGGHIGVLIGHRHHAGGFVAHPDDQRQGSFGNADLILSVTRQDGDEHVEAIDDDSARRLLTGAQVPDGVARRMVRHLHEGDAVMFVQLAQVDLGIAEALIGHRTVAA
jgi:hypothetical protein